MSCIKNWWFITLIMGSHLSFAQVGKPGPLVSKKSISYYDSLSNATYESDIDSALILLKKSNEVAIQMGDTFSIVDSFIRMGVWQYVKNDLQSSTQSYWSAINYLSSQTPDYFKLVSVYHNLGWNFAKNGDFAEALVQYNRALDYQRKTKNEKLLGRLYHSIGLLYKQRKEHQLALHYLLQVLDISKKSNDRSALATSYDELGEVYSELGDLESALDYMSKALRMNYLNNNQSEIINGLNNLSELLIEMGSCGRALDSLNKANRFSLEGRNLIGQMITCYNLYLTYKCLGNDQMALKCFIGYSKVADSIQSIQYDKELLQTIREQKEAYFQHENESLRRSFERNKSQLMLARSWIYLLLFLGVISIALMLILRRLINIKKTHTQHLEKTISLRTKELSNKNKFLEELIFMNAHNLRAPLSRILMIFSVLDSGIQILEIDTMDTIKTSAEEMDRAIHKIIESLSRDQGLNDN